MPSTSRSHTRGADAPPGFFCGRAISGAWRTSIRVLARLSAGGWLLGLVVPLLANAACCWADQRRLDPIVVTEEPIDDAAARAPTAFVTPIDVTERAERVETTADVLEDAPGVQVRRFGGLGAFTTLSVRGSSPNQVRFFLDGIPLSPAQNETVNVADLPLDSLQRIDVYRGTAPVGFGTGGIGGVVNLVTRAPGVRPLTTLRASYGSFDTRKLVASHSRRIGDLELLGYVTYLGSDGDFRFDDDNGTPLNPFDDERVNRQNNDFDSVDALLKAGYAITPKLHLDLTSESFFKDQGFPGISNVQTRRTSLADFRTVNYARVSRPELIGDRVDATATVFGGYEQTEFSDPEGEIGIGNQNRRDERTLVGGQLGTTVYPFSGHIVDWFSELSDERFEGSNRRAANGDDGDQTRLHLALALQDQASFFGDLVLVVPTIRYEHFRDRITTALTPPGQPLAARETVERDLWGGGLGVAVNPIRSLTIKGNLGRFQRAPNFSELFGVRGSTLGNNQLEPETGINRDVGAVFRWGRLGWLDRTAIEYAYFNNDVEDLIVLIQNSQGLAIPRNVGAARLRGHEVIIDLDLLDHLRLDFNYTRQDAENRDSSRGAAFVGKQLPGRPKDELHARCEVFGRRAKLFYEFDFIGGTSLNAINFRNPPSRDIHTLGFSVLPYGDLVLSLEVQNFTDNTISDVAGFPLPGLAFFGTLTFKHPSNTGGSS